MLNIDLQNMWRHLRFPKKAAKPKKNTYSAKQFFFVFVFGQHYNAEATMLEGRDAHRVCVNLRNLG